MGRFDKFCQSCGMPMEMDTEKGGTNQDGSKNISFCSHCYKDGKFNDSFTKAGEMKAFVSGKLREMGYGPLKRWFYTSHISQLARWKH
ncbi:MAG: zinc ribbon domain-containing protein [Bacteroidales bacterium]